MQKEASESKSVHILLILTDPAGIFQLGISPFLSVLKVSTAMQ